jgi:dsDNA-binding SOS-regulon protein
LQRIDSEISDKIIWINSIVQILHGYPLDKIKDEDENVIYDKLIKAFHELDDLLELSNSSFDENNETNISISISSFGQESKKRIIRAPKKKEKNIAELESKIMSILTKDENVNMIVLSKILKEKLL